LRYTLNGIAIYSPKYLPPGPYKENFATKGAGRGIFGFGSSKGTTNLKIRGMSMEISAFACTYSTGILTSSRKGWMV
jgi:hypothetical protein